MNATLPLKTVRLVMPTVTMTTDHTDGKMTVRMTVTINSEEHNDCENDENDLNNNEDNPT